MITEADKQQFFEDGYLLIEKVVPESLCADVRSTICSFLHCDADEPASWPESQSRGHGIVPIHHAQSLWNLRQYPAVHEAFAALHGTEALWVTYDRVSFKTRDTESLEQRVAEPIHWDGQPLKMTDLSIQGLVYLTDTTADQGAFCCVPELYRNALDYLAKHPEVADTRRPDVNNAQIEVIPGTTGSLRLWNRMTPHSSTRNLTDNPRWVQDVAMDPIGDEAARLSRIEEFQNSMPPQWAIVQKVPGQVIPETGGAAELTPLGKRLVGLDIWGQSKKTE